MHALYMAEQKRHDGEYEEIEDERIKLFDWWGGAYAGGFIDMSAD